MKDTTFHVLLAIPSVILAGVAFYGVVAVPADAIRFSGVLVPAVVLVTVANIVFALASTGMAVAYWRGWV